MNKFFILLIIILGLFRPGSAFAATSTVSFLYDGNGIRVAKIEEGKTTLYVGDTEISLGQSLSSTQKYYSLGNKRVAIRQSNPNSQLLITNYLIADHLGSIRSLTDSNGLPIPNSGMSYYPYGLLRPGLVSTNPSRTYTGQINDTATGLYFYNARYYNPQIANFITADANNQTNNRYQYANANPIFYKDPSGNTPEEYYPDLQPDINLSLRGYNETNGTNDYVYFNHDTDPLAPQLSTLIEGSSHPSITSQYQVNEWDWTNNSPLGPISTPQDINYGPYVSLIGLSTEPGQSILTPSSGYDIGEGYTAMVLYATENSLTLKYTREDDVVKGYTIHLENFEVSPNLLSFYRQLNNEGRNELPALLPGERIGKASNSEILVSIRDTGAFMDPRWYNDWWSQENKTKPTDLNLKSISVLE